MKILETIKQNHLLPTDETVVLLHDLEDDNEEFMTLSNWCQEQNWKFVHANEIMGSAQYLSRHYQNVDKRDISI